MSTLILTFLYIFAGLSLGFAIIGLILGFQKKTDYVYVTFGFMGISISIYYILYPYLENPDVYPGIIITGILSIMVAFGLLPWFFSFYTGFRNRMILWIIMSLLVVDFLLLIFSAIQIIDQIYWLVMSHVIQICIITYGIAATLHLRKKGERAKLIFMWIILTPMALLIIDDIVLHYFPSFFASSTHAGLLPLDFFPVFFMILVGGRLSQEVRSKVTLQKELIAKDKRLQDILNRISLLVIQVDKAGNVEYINPYFNQLTGYSPEEIIGHPYSLFIPEQVKEESRNKFKDVLTTNTSEPAQRMIQAKNGDILIINWSVVTLYDANGHPVGIITVGADISDQINACRKIETLKKQLECENIKLKTQLYRFKEEDDIIGESEAIRYVINRCKEVASTSASVFLEGETGTGKELIAQFIHKVSPRKDHHFVSINCAAIPKDLLESELFGYEKGAFTGATTTKKGRVESADQGTLFLDEVGDLPMELQPKLLRFLQDGQFNRLGSETGRSVDVRIIAATNKNLRQEVEKEQFREDLFFRLHVFPVTIPPLRKRRSDIPLLVHHFVEKYSGKYDKRISEISKFDMDTIRSFDWPGNVRELENVIESSVIGSNGKKLVLTKSLMKRVDKSKADSGQSEETLDEVERRHILAILERCNWRISGEDGAAARLGLHPNTLRSRMVKLKISKSFQ